MREQPRRRSPSTTALPRKPAPPVTTMLLFLRSSEFKKIYSGLRTGGDRCDFLPVSRAVRREGRPVVNSMQVYERSRTVPPRDVASFAQLFPSPGQAFRAIVDAKACQLAIDKSRLAYAREAEPQIVIHRVVQCFVDSANAVHR